MCFVLNAGYEILKSGSLKLWRPEVTDSGIYICVAENNAGRALGQVRLIVQGSAMETFFSPFLPF